MAIIADTIFKITFLTYGFMTWKKLYIWNSFVDENFTVEYFKRNSIKNTNEVYKFIKWIMGTYVAFKIMDIIEITADQIASFYANFNTTVIPIKTIYI